MPGLRHREGARKFVGLLLVALGWLTVPGPARAAGGAAPERLAIAGLQVSFWAPDGAGPWPILIFSHGFHGCGTQSSFLMAALANSGYAVFAPNHHDASCGKLVMARSPELPFRNPENWTDELTSTAPKTSEKLIDALKQDPRYGSAPFDWQHLGLIGPP